jgi:hypothetical protein
MGGSIAVCFERRGTQALLTVADTGSGVLDRFQPVLCDRFTKSRQSGLRGERLRMSVIKTIVDLHQGHIWLDTIEKQCTTFYVELRALPPCCRLACLVGYKGVRLQGGRELSWIARSSLCCMQKAPACWPGLFASNST